VEILQQMIVLFIIMGIGLAAYKSNIITSETRGKLSSIVVNIANPALILSSVSGEAVNIKNMELLKTLGIAVIVYLILIILAAVIPALIGTEPSSRGVYSAMTVFSNIGFMGFPIIDALYGTTAVLYTAIFNIMFNLSCYTLGTAIMTRNSETGTRINLRHLVNPGFLLSLASIVVYFLNPPFPKALADTVAAVGGITTPLSMLLIGSTLATNSVKEIFSDRFLYLYTVFRQILLPLVSLGLIHLLIKDELIQNVTCVMMLMPAANSCVMFANEYSADEKLASKSVFLTTLLSVITIPLGVSLLL